MSLRTGPFASRNDGRHLEGLTEAIADLKGGVEKVITTTETTLGEFSSLETRSRLNGAALEKLMAEIRGVRYHDGVEKKLTGLAQLDMLQELSKLRTLDQVNERMDRLDGSISKLASSQTGSLGIIADQIAELVGQLKNEGGVLSERLVADVRGLVQSVKVRMAEFQPKDFMSMLDARFDALNSLKHLSELENLNELAELGKLEDLSLLSRLDDLRQLDKLDNLENLSKLEQLSSSINTAITGLEKRQDTGFGKLQDFIQSYGSPQDLQKSLALDRLDELPARIKLEVLEALQNFKTELHQYGDMEQSKSMAVKNASQLETLAELLGSSDSSWRAVAAKIDDKLQDISGFQPIVTEYAETHQQLLKKLHDLESIARSHDQINYGELAKLSKLDKLESLSELAGLKQLESLDNLKQLEKLNQLDHLTRIDDIKEIFRSETSTTSNELSKLSQQLLQLAELVSLQKPNKPDQLEKLEEPKSLSELGKELSQLSNLARLDKLGQLDQLKQLENLASLSRLDTLQNLDQLKSLNSLSALEKLEKLDGLAPLMAKLEELSRPERLSSDDTLARVWEENRQLKETINIQNEALAEYRHQAREIGDLESRLVSKKEGIEKLEKRELSLSMSLGELKGELRAGVERLNELELRWIDLEKRVGEKLSASKQEKESHLDSGDDQEALPAQISLTEKTAREEVPIRLPKRGQFRSISSRPVDKNGR